MRTDVATFQASTTKQAQSQKGNALIEFALILPFFLALLVGMITFSVAFYDKIILTMATREGARAGAITGQETKAQDAADAFKNNLISFGTGATPIFTPDINTSTKIVTVKADYDYKGLYIFSDALKISATTSMRLE